MNAAADDDAREAATVKGPQLLPWLDTRLPALVLGFTVLAMMGEVVARTWLSHSFTGLSEITELAFAWIVLLGAAAAFRNDRAIVVESVYLLLAPRGRWLLLVLANAVTVTVAVYLVVVGAQFAEHTRSRYTLLLEMPSIFLTAALPVTMALIAFGAAGRLYRLAINRYVPPCRDLD